MKNLSQSEKINQEKLEEENKNNMEPISSEDENSENGELDESRKYKY